MKNYLAQVCPSLAITKHNGNILIRTDYHILARFEKCGIVPVTRESPFTVHVTRKLSPGEPTGRWQLQRHERCKGRTPDRLESLKASRNHLSARHDEKLVTMDEHRHESWPFLVDTERTRPREGGAGAPNLQNLSLPTAPVG
jgi:hypothetical protein